MIGRVREQQELDHWLGTGRPEFIVVYGRRRIGKTYLINQFFRGSFAFHATGAARLPIKGQLRLFHDKLREYGDAHRSAPTDWFEAFSRLKELLTSPGVTRDPVSGRIVVFLDEIPWMDTARSNFKSALEYFWNDWGSTRDDLMLIVCGSATSWLVTNLLMSTEGFYGRVTGSLNLRPFTLAEARALLRDNGLELTDTQVIELYLVFGGVPYYLNLARRGLSPAQVVDLACFGDAAPLRNEFDLLYGSLFKRPEEYVAVTRALSHRKGGFTDSELRAMRGTPNGASLRKVLDGLVRCGFVAKSRSFGKRSYGARYYLADPFVRFHFAFLERQHFDSWEAHASTPGYKAWRGNAFELVCLAHLPQIKVALGISGVETSACSWSSKDSDPGVQIDLLVDRADGIVDICEMKFTDAPYAPDKSAHDAIMAKRDVFARETQTRKALHLVLVTANEVTHNKYALDYQAIVTGPDLFA